MQTTAFIGGRPGLPELLLILLVILLIFGAKRLPELARALGKSLTEFKRGREEGLSGEEEEEPRVTCGEKDREKD